MKQRKYQNRTITVKTPSIWIVYNAILCMIYNNKLKKAKTRTLVIHTVYLFLCLFVVFLFVCLFGVFIPLENFSFMWRIHHYRWRASNVEIGIYCYWKKVLQSSLAENWARNLLEGCSKEMFSSLRLKDSRWHALEVGTCHWSPYPP